MTRVRGVLAARSFSKGEGMAMDGGRLFGMGIILAVVAAVLIVGIVAAIVIGNRADKK